jgi:outer membrane protein assembly factor BamB
MRPEEEVFNPETVDEQVEQLSRSLYAIPSRQGRTTDAQLVQNLHRMYELEQEDARSVARVQRQLEQQGWLAPERRRRSRPERRPEFQAAAYRERRPRGWTFRLATIAAVLLVTTLIGGLVVGLVLVHPNKGSQPVSTATPTSALAQHTVYTIAPHDTVIALNAATGLERWRHISFGTLNSGASLALDGNVLYIGSYAGVEAVNSKDGKTLWQAETGDTQSQLIVQNGVVYVGASENLSALNAQNGKVLWSVTGSPPYLLEAVADGVVYAETATTFAAYDAATGALLWQKETNTLGDDFWGAVNGVAIFTDGLRKGDTSGLTVYALNARDGTVRWGYAKTVEAVLFGALNNVLYGETTTDTLFALDTNTGVPLWQVQDKHTVYSAVLLTDVGILLGTDQGTAEMRSLSTGALLWKTQVASTAYFIYPIAEAQGTAYIFDPNPLQLYALNSADGLLRWHVAAQDGGLFVGQSNGVVFMITNLAVTAFNVSDGSVLWHLTQGTIAGQVLLG